MPNLQRWHLSFDACLQCLILQLLFFVVCNVLWVDDSFFQLAVQPDSRINIEVCLEKLGIGPDNVNSSPYSHLLCDITLPLITRLGFTKWPFFIVQTFFAAMWVISTYLLGKEWFGKRTGLAAASLLLWSMQPAIMVRNFLLDYPAAAVLTLQLYFLFKSQFFTKWLYSGLFLALIPLVVTIKTHHFLCLAPILLGLSITLLHRDYKRLKETPHPFTQMTLFTQLTIPILCAAVSWYNGFPLAVVCAYFCAGIILQSLVQSLTLYRASRKNSEGIIPPCSPFLTYQIGVALALLATICIIQLYNGNGDSSLHAQNNIGIPSLWIDNIGSTLSGWGCWIIGHVIEIKTKNLQLFPFLLYSVGLIVALVSPRLLKGYSFLVYTTLCTSLLMSLFTYNSVRYQAPLMELRCIFAVFWIGCIEKSHILFKATAYLLIAVSIAFGVLFNAAWLVGPSFPRTSVQILFNEFGLVNDARNDTDNIEVFERPYNPQVRFEFTSSIAKNTSKLYNTHSVYGSSLFFTCDPYPIDWSTFAIELCDNMRPPLEKAYIFVDLSALKEYLFLRSDEIQQNLNCCYRVATSSPIVPILNDQETYIPSHFAVVATAPNSDIPRLFGDTAQPIYLGECDSLALWLFEFQEGTIL